MKYGIRWYTGVGEHGYEESGYSEYTSMHALLEGLHMTVGLDYGEDLLFDALAHGRQDTVYWVADDFGFELYRVR